jgi:hypothetical protein
MLRGLARNIVGMIRYDRRSNGKLKTGDAAPDAQVLGLDGRTTHRLLGSAGTKPLVLVFGSFT